MLSLNALAVATLAEGCGGGGGGGGGSSSLGGGSIPPTGPTPASVRTFGVTIINGSFDPVLDMPILSQTQTKLARIPFAWDQIQTGLNTYFWDYYDAVIAALLNAKIKPLLVTGTTNPIFGTNAVTGSGLSACAAFHRIASARYPSAWWEVGNEPNLAQFWPPAPNASQYADYCTAVANALRQSSPQTKILTGGTSGVDVNFIRGFLRPDLLAAVDYIAFHPYGVDPNSLASQLAQVRSSTSKPLFASEYGTPGPDSSSALTQMAFACGNQGVPFIWYRLKDGLDPGNTYGLFTADRQPKPTLDAAIAYAALDQDDPLFF